MQGRALKLTLFISSPGDVAEERNIAGRVLLRLHSEFAARLDLEAVFWEHEPLLATRGFQDQLIRPSEADIVVCILWSRLGTRLPASFRRRDGTSYESGTEFELEDALESYRRRGAPDLLVYRKTSEPMVSLRDEETLLAHLRQKKALDRFVERWFHEPESGAILFAFHPFATSAQFEELLEVHLRTLVERRAPGLPIGDEPAPPTAIWTAGSPFRGLQLFEVEHAPIFFGRSAAVGDVLNALRRQAAQGCRFVLVTGMSGCGKSSLVRAGVLPLLTQPGVMEGAAVWRRAVVRPRDCTEDLFAGLATALMRDDALPELGKAVGDFERLADALRAGPGSIQSLIEIGLSLAAADDPQATGPRPVHLVLVIDPMEEVFTSERVSSTERGGFVTALACLARTGRVWVIATLRSDFFARCEEVPELLALKAGDGTYHLLPPNASELGQIIRLPARAAGVRFEEDLETQARLDEVLRDGALARPGVLPLLEFTLDELFKQKTASGVLTFATYQSLGGVEGALARRAEEVFTGLPPAVQAQLPKMLRALVGLHADQPQAIRRSAPLESLTADAESRLLIERFVEARLFATDRADDGRGVITLTHEALIEHWPRLNGWLQQNQEFLRIRARVESAAGRWEQEERREEFLLVPGKPLAEARELRQHKIGEITPQVAEFIAASTLRAERARRRRTATFATASLLLALFSAFSYVQWRRSEERALTIQLAQRAAAALDAFPRQPGLAMESLLAMSKESLAQFGGLLPPLRRSLKSALDSREMAVFSGHGGVVSAAVWSPDSKWIVSASVDGSVGIWDRGGHLIRQFVPAPAKPTDTLPAIRALALSPDGRAIITGSDDGALRLWGLAGDLRIVLAGGEAAINAVAFDPSGKLLASAASDGRVRLWDVAGKPVGKPFQRSPGALNAVAFSPDGRTVAAAGVDRKVFLWDLSGHALGEPLAEHQAAISALAFSPDGSRLATAGLDHTAQLWDLGRRDRVAICQGHEAEVTSVAFRPDGRLLATGSLDKTARLWDVQGRSLVILGGHEDGINSVAFSPDGKRLVTAAGDHRFAPEARRDYSLRVWDATTALIDLVPRDEEILALAFSPDGSLIAGGGRHLALYSRGGRRVGPYFVPLDAGGDRPARVRAVAFRPGGRSIATASDDGRIRLWDLRGHILQVPVLAQVRGDPMSTVAFSPDGALIAGGDDRGTVWIFNDSPGVGATSFRAHAAAVNGIAWSRDGRRLASAGDEATARLWDRRGRSMGELRGHSDDVTCIAWSPDGKLIATGSRDRTVRVWDASGRPVAGPMRGHARAINSVAFSPDGTFLVSAAEDRTLRFWDLDGTALGLPNSEHQESVEALAFSPDGQLLASASQDSTVRLWTVGGDGWLRRACEERRERAASSSSNTAVADLCRRVATAGLGDLNVAAVRGDAARLRQLLRSGAAVDGTNSAGTRPLEIAAQVGDEASARELIAAHASVNARDAEGNTPLLLAAFAGSSGVLRLLMDSGADSSVHNRAGDSALMLAIRSGESKAVEILLAHGAAAGLSRDAGKLALSLASDAGRGDLVNLLVDAGIAPQKPFGAARNPSQYTALPRTFRPSNLDAETRLGLAYEEGDGVPQSFAQAAEHYRKAALRGSAHAQFRLGRAYRFGIGVPPNLAEMAGWYRKAVAGGDLWALRNLGGAYLDGEGVARDLGRGFTMLQEAARRGHPWAATDVGYCYRDGTGVGRDFSAAARWFRIGAKGTDSVARDAQEQLGDLYAGGLGVERSMHDAADWYRTAAAVPDKRHATVLFKLGWMYEGGLGVPAAETEALRLYSQAAELGVVEAQRRLGWLYDKGVLVSASAATAAEWYSRAATAGDSCSQLMLGAFFEAGRGVPRSAADARAWYRKAAAGGGPGSEEARSRLQALEAPGGLLQPVVPSAGLIAGSPCR